MSYIADQIDPGERIVYRARTHWVAYISAILYLAGGLMPGRFTGLVTTELALTDKRALGRVGMVRQKTLALKHKDIEGVHVQQGLLGKLFDYGTLTITGNDGSRVTFKGIAEPLDVRIQIEEAVEMAVLGRKLSQVVMEKW